MARMSDESERIIAHRMETSRLLWPDLPDSVLLEIQRRILRSQRAAARGQPDRDAEDWVMWRIMRARADMRRKVG
jgi:hypothetical protein